MVQALETSLQKLLEGTKQYQVPLYQRTYAWKKDQFVRLWDDLVKLAEDRKDRGPNATHFIGSLVLAPSPSVGPAGVAEYLVVDGQQRLTTLTLLLTAIRDHRSESEDPSHLDRINEKYLINKWEPGQPTKLLPTQADRGSYLACIHRTPQAGGADPVGTAYRFFRSKLTELDDPEDDLDIQRLEDAVIAGLSVVCVTAQQGDNVHRIFESLNNTGLRLTQGDLIRNYLFMRLPNRGEHVYENVWLPLQDLLTSEQLELLFWLDLVQADETAKQADTYALQQARLDRFTDEGAIEAEVERLARLGELLKLMLTPTLEADPNVRLRLERLNAWGTTTVYPVLLHLLDRRAQGQATGDEIATAMLYLESFFIRRIIVGKATANINRILLRAVTEIRDSHPVDAALRDYLSTGRRYFATDDEIANAARTVPFYWTGKAHQRNLILRWLEQSYGSKEPVEMAGLSIEHVLPQTPTAEWLGALEVNLEAGEDVRAVHQSLLHTLGNLTLTGYNSELSNSPFATKRAHLATSGLRMNQEIAEHASWSRPQILERADRLAGRVAEIWPGPSSIASEGVVAGVWVALAQVLAAVPAGAWTTYGDVAAVIGTHPVPLGQRLANHPVPNAHRVLAAGGTVAPAFRWLDPARTDAPRDVLRSEGVEIDESGVANPAQRLSAEELATLAGLDTAELDLAPLDGGADADRYAAFLDQLAARQPPAVADGVRAVLDAWVLLGGRLAFGSAELTSCFLMATDEPRSPWPFSIYPSGRVDVVFQYMANRPPFDDVSLRHAFRERLNTLDGVDLPEAKIDLRPGFRLELFAMPSFVDAVVEHLAWFFAEAQVEPDDDADLSNDDNRMTLHEALAVVLRSQGNRWMSARELADAVNEQGLYQRRDRAPVPSSQVHARTRNYSAMFERSSALIRLRSQ